MKNRQEKKIFSELEGSVMEVVWNKSPCSAEQVRESLSETKILKDSTIRTILRRLEEKGYLQHQIEGRTFLYKPTISRYKAAARALQKIVNRFCGGSIEELLIGMVNDEMLSTKELEEMAKKIAKNAKKEK